MRLSNSILKISRIVSVQSKKKSGRNMLLTYKYKLYNAKKNKRLGELINIAGVIYNHCIALNKRYYKLYGKSLNKYKLQKHITKLKKRAVYKFWNKLGS